MLRLLFLIFSLISLPLSPQAFALQDMTRYEKLGTKLDAWSEAQIQFWVKIFTEYSSGEGVLHDSMNLKYIYSVVPAVPASGIEKEKKKIREALKSIAAKKARVDELTADELKLYEIHEANEDARSYQFSAENERIRVQLGQKDRLENAYQISRHYLKRMEEMFEEEGVPKELTRLPFVESGFSSNAKSSVGAIGIWQFMPKTAMRDLRIDANIDERYDPLKSTRAAAHFLMSNYKLLKNWSLAVMAYHHGPGLVKKAVNQLQSTSPVWIIQAFKDPNFKFASRNYLFEFLAMLDVDSMHALFFKDAVIEKLPAFITVSFQKKMRLPDVIQQFKLNEAEIKLLNPHFLNPIWSGKGTIPAHYPVRLSRLTLADFRKAFP